MIMSKFPVAVQPYTVRKAMDQDYVGTLKKIADIGYTGIELGRPPEGFTISQQKALLDSIGLQVIGTHAGFDTLDFDPDSIADYLEEVDGGKYATISLRFHSKEDVLAKAKKMNVIGEQFRKRGVQFLYHNHDWEFETYHGESVLDLILRETDPSLVQLELDTYWVQKGGEDPSTYLAKLHGRCPLLHIKDMEAGEEKFFAEIGEGILDFKRIAKVAEEVGTKWLVVEQDDSRRDPFESLAISYRNLKNMELI
jgi:sugar phosphate isomerase/epimerase